VVGLGSDVSFQWCKSWFVFSDCLLVGEGVELSTAPFQLVAVERLLHFTWTHRLCQVT
jgi:hypothetical protein